MCTAGAEMPISLAMLTRLSQPPTVTPKAGTAATPAARVAGLPSAGQLVSMQVAATIVGIGGGALACVFAQNTGWEGVAPYLLGAGVALGVNLLPGIGLLTVQLGRRLLGVS